MMSTIFLILLLSGATHANVEVIDVDFSSSLNRSIPIKKHSLVVIKHNATHLRELIDYVTLEKISKIFSTNTMIIDASHCSVWIYEERDCAKLLQKAEESSKSGILSSV